MLECDSLVKRFGGLVAVDGVSLQVQSGEIVALVGPNGAGKTTLLNLLSGLLPLDSGQIRLRGARIDGLPPWRIARLGVGRTFQVPRVFELLSVAEHVRTGTVARALVDAGRRAAEAVDDEVRWALRMVRLEDRAACRAGQEPPGRRKLVELATVLGSRPRLLLLDEPLAGLHPRERQFAVGLLHRMRDERGVGILWVEHDMETVTRAADRVVVLHRGKVIADGPPPQVMEHPEVVRAYLGGIGGESPWTGSW